MTNIYHFSLHLQFSKDCDVNLIEKTLGVSAYKKSSLNESKGKNKTAKLWFKSNDYDNPDTYSCFKNFVNKHKKLLELIGKFNNEFNGKTTFTIYFDKVPEKPYIKLEKEEMLLLAVNNISFEVDFRI